MPPPCSMDSLRGPRSRHPGSPARGVVFQRHCTRSGFRIARFQVTRHVQRIAAHADDDVVLDHERRGRAEIFLLHVGDLGGFQRIFPVLGVERNQIAIRRLEVQPVAIHAEAAIADVDAALGVPVEAPELASAAGVHRPGVIGDREVQNAVDFERRSLDRDVPPTARRPPGREAAASTPRFSVLTLDRLICVSGL